MALILSNQELHEESLEFYKKVFDCDPSGYFSSMDVGILGFKTHHNMGGVLIALDRYEEAKEQFKVALEKAAHFSPSAFELFDQALLNRDFPTALFALDHIGQQEGEGQSWAEMTAKYAEMIGGPENVRATMTPLAQSNVHARKTFAQWLVRNGHEEQAAEYWPSLQENGDAESAYFLGVQDVRRGRFEHALQWMQRALTLNPDHKDTIEQIDGLETALAEAN